MSAFNTIDIDGMTSGGPDHDPEKRCSLAVTIEAEGALALYQNFADHVLTGLVAESVEEIGDCSPSPFEFMLERKESFSSDEAISQESASRIVSSSITCLQQMYLGNCAMLGCSERQAMTEKLAELWREQKGQKAMEAAND